MCISPSGKPSVPLGFPDEAHDAQLWDYLVMAAQSLVNQPSAPRRPDLGLSPT